MDETSLRRIILDITDEMKLVISEVYKRKFWIEWYGAFYINPRHFVFWICFETYDCKFKLNSNLELILRLKNLLYKYNYPKEAIDSVFIGFESQETVDRESGGNWFQHFK